MYVTVAGKKIEIGVSELGVFYDKPAMKFNANTLAGLKKKMLAAKTPKSGVPVENEDGKKGVVSGRKGGKKWSRNYFIVLWENGTTEECNYAGLLRPLSSEDRAELNRLSTIVDEAQAGLTKAERAYDDFHSNLQLGVDLDIAFPMV